jgi:signal transduction histidine kinase
LNAIEAMPQGGVLKLTTKLKSRQESIQEGSQELTDAAKETAYRLSLQDVGLSPTRKPKAIGYLPLRQQCGSKMGEANITTNVSQETNGETSVDIAEITISDTGCGISDKDLDKIFKSGFTTKASSGLGLAEVRRIINTCGGKIEVHSQLGVGTNLVIQLPCHSHL